ncbi:MAG: ribonuclease III [Bacteroidetes bacterium]|nr:ribonuclease III [Bacteroidota bacterium]
MRILKRFFKKTFTEEERLLYRFLKEKFGYSAKDITIFIQAITHKSISFTEEDGLSNERLEFLGDAAIDSIIAEYLFLKFPAEDEGYLTKIKSKLVSRKNFSEIAENIGIRQVLRYQKGRAININTIEGNAFEALMGAILLDGGYEVLKKVLSNHILIRFADINKVLEEEIDFKSKLFIWCQKNKLEVEFKVLTEENHGGFWKYTLIAVINNKTYGMGSGSSKKIAEQAASRETLELMGEL